MKKGFIKNRIVYILLILAVIFIAIKTGEILFTILAVLYVMMLIRLYIQYDYEDIQADKWWLSLDKPEKVRIKSENEGDKNE